MRSWILGGTIGYGYKPFRALWFILCFVVVGSVLFSWGYQAGVITPTDKKQSQQSMYWVDRATTVLTPLDSVAESAEPYLPFNSFVYSLESFLPVVDLHLAKHWLPDPQVYPTAPVILFAPVSQYEYQFGAAFGKYLRIYLWIHILAGWFFTSMFVAGFTGLVRRE